jgi:hypothetical protein
VIDSALAWITAIDVIVSLAFLLACEVLAHSRHTLSLRDSMMVYQCTAQGPQYISSTEHLRVVDGGGGAISARGAS